MTYSIQTITPADFAPVVELQKAYAQEHPGVPVFPGEMYVSPGFHEGADVFCAFDEQHRLVAYAPVFVQIIDLGPEQLPHIAWTEVQALPGLADARAVKDALLDCVQRRARSIAAGFPGRGLRLTFEYRQSEAQAIDYVLSRGFQCIESVFSMTRDLTLPIPAGQAPAGVTIRRWKMESEPEQVAYLEARNECFPEAPLRLADWQYYMQSPQWQSGTMIAAFEDGKVVGCVNVYWTPGDTSGATEDIFVRAPWRGRGIARAMIAEGLAYLKEHGLVDAHLGVRALNDNALGLYRQMGFAMEMEIRFYGKNLEPGGV